MNKNPTRAEIEKMWQELKITKIPLSQSGVQLEEVIENLHANGGGLIDKFQIDENQTFKTLVREHKLYEANFPKRFFRNKGLIDYIPLKDEEGKAKCKNVNFKPAIYHLPSELLQILVQGGAYNKLDSQEAWKILIAFFEDEIENRFDDFVYFSYILDSNWFWDIAWDYSALILDKRKLQVITFAITDTN